MLETKKPRVILSELIVKEVYKNNRGYWLVDIDNMRYEIDEETYRRYVKNE